MSTEKMREEFENSPRFKGMDFTRAPGHPDYYESPYANGAWDGWKASRESLVIELPTIKNADWACTSDECEAMRQGITMSKHALNAIGLKVKP
jgi:hypothetical protein